MKLELNLGSKKKILKLPSVATSDQEFEIQVDEDTLKVRWDSILRVLLVQVGQYWRVIRSSRVLTNVESTSSYSIELESLNLDSVMNLKLQLSPCLPAGQSAVMHKKAKTRYDAPMNGKIIGIEVNANQPVEKNKVLIVVEAMKMENKILCEANAIIKKIHVKLGDAVVKGQPLLEVTSDNN